MKGLILSILFLRSIPGRSLFLRCNVKIVPEVRVQAFLYRFIILGDIETQALREIGMTRLLPHSFREMMQR